MDEQNKSQKRRERIKTLLIIFLVILLLLTFFSNTILNYSLPTVSAQYASYGTITEKIRGSGTVTANQNYDVTAEGKRVVASVYIKAGDEVKAGDKLFSLDAEDNNDEIKAAESALQEAELAYQKALLTAVPDYAAENQEIANAKADLQTAINKLNQAKNKTQAVSDYAYQQAVAEAKNCTSEMELLSGYLSSVMSGELDGIPAQYTADLRNAQEAVQNATKKLESAHAEAEAKTITVSSAEQQQTVISLEREAEKAQIAYDRAKADYESAKTYGIPETVSSSDEEDTPVYSLTDMERAVEDAAQTLRYANEDVENAKKLLNSIKEQEQALADIQETVRQAQAELETAQAVYKSASSGISSLIQADMNAVSARADAAQSTITAYENQKSEDAGADVDTLQEAVAQQERNLQDLLLKLTQQKKEDTLTQQIGKLELQSQQNAINQQKEELEKLKQAKDTKIITSKNDGIVSTVSCAAGDTVMDGDNLASITLTGSGYTAQITVTAEQARRLHAGMNAEITNQYYSDITATLASIKQEAGNNDSRTLVFNITGKDAVSGQLLALSIQTSSENYDCVVPSSAIMEDNKGKFVLIINAKSTPLGNRYYVSRSDVTVIAHDEINSAVQGDMNSSDFVVTTSEKPLTAGMQVRMEEKNS
ncbi:MAG: HlyD family efflux transporter periplasmic adaptor subunit [Oscillospiraceae bacterium]|nr:HlyD family efflux transporter periplasmic adaptor subunit [Oscillospiraceae bacterium]